MEPAEGSLKVWQSLLPDALQGMGKRVSPRVSFQVASLRIFLQTASLQVSFQTLSLGFPFKG
jgi:hypothetical protein